MHHTTTLNGAGLGLRRELLPELLPNTGQPPQGIGFLELAPENWMGLGGSPARRLRQLTERYAVVCHGLSLSLGGPRPLDVALLEGIRDFMDTHGIALYTEHLSWCGDEAGHLYDLLPLPFTEEAVRHVAGQAAKRVLVEFTPAPAETTVTTELSVQEQDGAFTPEYRTLLRDLELHF